MQESVTISTYSISRPATAGVTHVARLDGRVHSRVPANVQFLVIFEFYYLHFISLH